MIQDGTMVVDQMPREYKNGFTRHNVLAVLEEQKAERKQKTKKEKAFC